MTTATAETRPNIAFIKFTLAKHDRTNSKGGFVSKSSLTYNNQRNLTNRCTLSFQSEAARITERPIVDIRYSFLVPLSD